ncbi:hypothetical protein BHU72_09500 [Desulfuribacillus stibiiarsenatis]|uniref:Uncharacterized protein n=1 Tax=Desulfuribacillus stibiiarsenatis TaxID=1390249 RepID=A0A1E5L303_9FIRM|nr:hypothetical protein [Desulfuribacillus stibiiarsenatis]OEH84443.1 hypothetical protein BHU72_09500 [Desulfuribacillus stibiiarsenatis]
MLKKLVSMYVIYVVYFLGIGMTSSGIVLMPFNFIRYSTVLLFGLLLFTAGSYINEFVIDKKQISVSKVLKLIFSSLGLAIGIGMISGGIAHFKEAPIYVSYLIPSGIVISLLSFTVKNEYSLTGKEAIVLIFGSMIISAIIFTGLYHMATNYLESPDAKKGGDIFMNH